MRILRRRKPVRSLRRRRERRRKRIRKVIVIGLGTAALLGGIAYGARLDAVTIQQVAVSGNETVAEADIQRVVEERLSGSLLFLVPYANTLAAFFREGIVERALLGAYPRLREVSASLRDLNTLHVAVAERAPHSLWCGTRYETVTETFDTATTTSSVAATSTVTRAPTLNDTSETCYFLDEDGFLFARAPSFTGNVYFRYYGPVAGEPLRSQFMLVDTFHQYQLFLDEMEDLPIVPIALERDTEMNTFYLARGGKILFPPQQSLGDVLENIQTVLTADAFTAEGTLDRLDYIDLRFGNEVYYRFNDP